MFGSRMEESSSWDCSSSQSMSTQNLYNANYAKVKRVEARILVGGSVCSLLYDKSYFVSGSNGNNDGNLFPNWSLESYYDSFYELNSSKNVERKSEKSNYLVNGEKKSNIPREYFHFRHSDGLFGEQLNKTSKMDRANSNVDCQKADTNLCVRTNSRDKV